MKKAVVLVGLLVLAWSPPAHAGVLDWPGVSQVWKIGSCVVADAGKITQSAIRHVGGLGIDVLTIVADCAKFVVDTLTPGTIPDPH